MWLPFCTSSGGGGAAGGTMSKSYSLKGKVPREVARPIAEELVAALRDTQIVGSLRRGCAVVGDVDLMTTERAAPFRRRRSDAVQGARMCPVGGRHGHILEKATRFQQGGHARRGT